MLIYKQRLPVYQFTLGDINLYLSKLETEFKNILDSIH